MKYYLTVALDLLISMIFVWIATESKNYDFMLLMVAYLITMFRLHVYASSVQEFLKERGESLK